MDSTTAARSLPASPRVQAKNATNLQGGNVICKSSSQLSSEPREDAKKKLLQSTGKKILIVPATAASLPDGKKPAPPLSPALSLRLPQTTRPGLADSPAPRKPRATPAVIPSPLAARADNGLPLPRCPSSDGARTPPKVHSLQAVPAAALKPQVDMWTPGSGHKFRSMRSLRDDPLSPTSWASMQLPADVGVMSDAASIRSLASIGMGSTDGRKLTIRRVPTSPNELLNYSLNGTPM